MRRVAILILVLSLGAAPARAESWYRGPHGKNRVAHLSLTVGLGLGFLATESVLKRTLAAETCRWCTPPGLDVSVRDALVWGDYEDAQRYSDLTGYIAVPLFGVGISALSALQAEDASWGRLLDDTIPILESAAIGQAITQTIKFAVGRQRPFVHYRNPSPGVDDNLSFISGHSSLVFSIATSAGLVAHWRRSRLEPVVWAVGMPLAAATAYLRIAGDKHYFTDVVTGSLVGVGVGLLVPRLMRRPGVVLVPRPDGVALVGAF